MTAQARTRKQENGYVGRLFIISGPSGAGKTSVCTPVLDRLPGLELSVSFTTRRPRSGEVEGRDYRFVSDAVFDSMIEGGEFGEHARVHGSRYGTSKRFLDDAIGGGRSVLLDIDVQGARKLRLSYPQARTVFLLPPSRKHLERRLAGRGTEDDATVQGRLGAACAEIEQARSYDLVIVNDRLDKAVDRLVDFIKQGGAVEKDEAETERIIKKLVGR